EVPTHHSDVRFRLGVIIHPERHLDTHSVPVGEHPPEGLLGRLNGQRMIGALGSHFQNLAIKQLHPGAGWEHTADHQLIVLRSSPPLRSNAHRRPPDLVYQTTLDEGTAATRGVPRPIHPATRSKVSAARYAASSRAAACDASQSNARNRIVSPRRACATRRKSGRTTAQL